LIAERGLVPGDRLPAERSLAVELSVSRSSLREGSRRLLDLGVLEARQGSGTYVAEVDLDDLLKVRLRVEPYAASLAAQRRSDRDLQRLDELMIALRGALPDPEAFALADVELHAAVVDAAGSAALRVLLEALGDMLRYSRATTAPDEQVRATALGRLADLVRAIRERDASAAERAMRTHLLDLGTQLSTLALDR
jgi:DNA-binding FadR family transcriptional regulator